MSRFGNLESIVGAQLATLKPSTFNDTRMVAAGLLLSTRPDAGMLPCAFGSLIGAKMTKFEVIGSMHSSFEWDVEFGVLIIANSDGNQEGDARGSAWTLLDAVITAFANLFPTGFGSDTKAMAPVELRDPFNLMTDVGQAAVYLPMNFKIKAIL